MRFVTRFSSVPGFYLSRNILRWGLPVNCALNASQDSLVKRLSNSGRYCGPPFFRSAGASRPSEKTVRICCLYFHFWLQAGCKRFMAIDAGSKFAAPVLADPAGHTTLQPGCGACCPRDSLRVPLSRSVTPVQDSSVHPPSGGAHRPISCCRVWPESHLTYDALPYATADA